MAIPSPYYRVSIKALIFNDQSQLLVMQRRDDGYWELPGGGLEHGETMQFGLRREVMEELCVGIGAIDFGTMFPYIGRTTRGTMGLKLAVRAELESTDFKLEDKFKHARYVTAQELAALEMRDDEAGIKVHIPRIWP